VAKSGGLRSLKALEFEKWDGSSLAALQKFTPMGLWLDLGLHEQVKAQQLLRWPTVAEKQTLIEICK